MRLTRTSSAPFAAVLAAATLATPATAARLDHSTERRSVESATAPAQDLRSPDTRDAADGRSTRNTPAPIAQNLSSPDARDASAGRTTADVASPVIQVRPAAGFDWGDAGIGAAGAAGLLAISLAGAMTLRRRQLDPRSPAAVSER